MRFILMVRPARRIMLLVGYRFILYRNCTYVYDSTEVSKIVAYSTGILKSVTRNQRRMLHDSKIET